MRCLKYIYAGVKSYFTPSPQTSLLGKKKSLFKVFILNTDTSDSLSAICKVAKGGSACRKEATGTWDSTDSSRCMWFYKMVISFPFNLF